MQNHDHNIRIYTADAALQAEDAVLAAGTPNMSQAVNETGNAINEHSLAHFCAFVDFYTRKAADPLSTSLACEKQAEAVEIAPDEVTPENMRMMMDTMLEVIDHLEKKWLDEQLKHEDRQRQHREDVAGLYAKLRAQETVHRQPVSRKPWYHSVQGLFGAINASDGQPAKRRRKVSKRRPAHVTA